MSSKSEPVSGIRQAHIVLYNEMCRIHLENKFISKEDILHVYNEYVIKNKKYWPKNPKTDTTTSMNAMQWFDRALVVLVKRGYLGFTYLKKPNLLPKEVKPLKMIEAEVSHF